MSIVVVVMVVKWAVVATVRPSVRSFDDRLEADEEWRTYVGKRGVASVSCRFRVVFFFSSSAFHNATFLIVELSAAIAPRAHKGVSSCDELH